MTESEFWFVATHEVGHAILVKELLPYKRVYRITIIPEETANGGRSSGKVVTEIIAIHEKTEQDYLNEIAMNLGGIVALEIEKYEGLSYLGCESDMKQALHLAKEYVEKYSLKYKISKILKEKTLNNREMQAIEKKILKQEGNKVIERAMEIARTIITKHASQFAMIRQELVEKRQLTREQFEMIYENINQ